LSVRRGPVAALLAFVALAIFVPASQPVLAATNTTSVAKSDRWNPSDSKITRPRGLVPRSPHATKSGLGSANPNCGGCNPPLLFTQGDPVMGGLEGHPGHVTITPVYWAPAGYTFSASYKSIVNGYLQNVAAASGTTTNVFSVATEYYQQAFGSPAQSIQYAITAGAEVDDTSVFPTVNTCTPSGGFTACIADVALQAELRTKVASLGLPMDDAHLYVTLFPQGVETCLGTGLASSSNECSSNVYCAYHSSTSSPYLIYTNQPYPNLSGCADPFDGTQAPNGDPEADTQVSLISHEANEAITDWSGTWADSAGFEDGDECAYVYGSPLGSTGGAGTLYNQVIGTGHYYTQDEFSNSAFAANSGDPTHAGGATVPGCLQHAQTPVLPVVSGILPSTGSSAGGTSVTINGSGFSLAATVSFGGVAATITSASANQIVAVSPAHGAGAIDIVVTTNGGTSASGTSDQFTYVLVQSACSTNQYTLTGSDGATWNSIDSNRLTISFTPGADSLAILGGNADLWTASAGYNQDLGIQLDSALVGWKESGGSAGTYSPNAAFAQAVVPVSAGHTYTARLVWKTNKPDAGMIAAGAGPINGAFSETCLDLRLVPGAVTKSSTTQYALANSDGATWQPIDATNLAATVTPTASGVEVITGNADLWTAAAGYNQDIGLFVSVNGGTDQLVGWKESGGFAGTFSPNAAFVESTWPVSSGSTYKFTLKWKASKSAIGATIYAGAGPINGAYSQTRLTAEFEPTAVTAVSTKQYSLANGDGVTWKQTDVSGLAVSFTPSVSGNYSISGNADLWTANAGVNQDFGIFISGGSFTTPTLLAWKESGGLGGTFSPNAAYVQTVVSLQASTTYNVWLVWKTNKPAGGATIYAAAGPLPGGATFSPTRLTIIPQ
jgi:hypothetical protein